MTIDADDNISEKGPRRILIAEGEPCRYARDFAADVTSKCPHDNKTLCDGVPGANGRTCFLEAGPIETALREVVEGAPDGDQDEPEPAPEPAPAPEPEKDRGRYADDQADDAQGDQDAAAETDEPGPEGAAAPDGRN
jgi:hypothetical protein